MSLSITFPSNSAIISGVVPLQVSTNAKANYISFTIDNVERIYAPGWVGTSYSGLINAATCATNVTHSMYATAYRSSMVNFTPTGIANCVTWIDAADKSKLFANSGCTIPLSTLASPNGIYVSGVVDKAGAISAFSTPLGKTAPVYLENQYNKLPSLIFTAANSSILENPSSYTSQGFIMGSGDVFMVVKMGSTTGQTFFGSAGNSNNFIQFGCQNNRLIINGGYNGSINQPTGSTPLNTNTLYSLDYRSLSGPVVLKYGMEINGVSETIGLLSGANNGLWFDDLVSPTNITIGGTHYGSSYEYATVNICEIIVYSRNLTVTEKNSVQLYLAEKWGTNWSSPITYTQETSNTINFTANDASGVAFPTWIQNHYPHIKTWELAYQGAVNTSNGPPSDKDIINNSIDMLLGGNVYQLRNTFGNSGIANLQYNIMSQLPDYMTADWINYADNKGYNREEAFIHATGTPYSLTSTAAGSSPAAMSVWWDAASGINNQLGSMWLSYNRTKLNDFTQFSLSNISGNYILVGYPDYFDRLTYYINAVGAGGWSGVIEYPYAVDSNNVPTGWATFSLTKDTTSMLSAKSGIPGTMSWFPFQSPAWRRSVPVSGGSPGIDAKWPLYYARLKTTQSGSSAPTLSGIWAADFANQSGIAYGIGAIPVFDSAADLNRDGYISEAENTGVLRNPAYTARFYYQSRIPSSYGTPIWTSNTSSAKFREWVINYWGRVNATNFSGLNNGVFLDSSVIGPFPNNTTVENTNNLNDGYAVLLNNLWQSYATGLYRSLQGIVMPNVGVGEYTGQQKLMQYCPAQWYETFLQDSDSWKGFDSHISRVDNLKIQFSPEPIQVLDSYSNYGNTTDRWRTLLLAAYYICCTSGTYFSSLSDNGTITDLNPNRWIPSIANNIGYSNGYYTVVSGTDPENASYRYKVYQRQFTNGLVLYKPLSYNDTSAVAGLPGTGVTNSLSVTTHSLGAYYKPISSDGSMGAQINSIQLRNGEGAILYGPINNPVTSGQVGIVGGTQYSIEGESVVVFAPKGSQISIGVVRRGIGWQSANPFDAVIKYNNRFTKVGIRQNPSGTYVLTSR